MPPDPIIQSASGIDLSPRFSQSNAVVGSPAAAAETVVATTPAFQAGFQPAVLSAVVIVAQCAFTVGTSGVSARYRIRQGTGTGGTVVFDSGITNAGIAATNLVIENLLGIDTAPGALPAQQYSLTLTIGSGSAVSTVSAVAICALAI